MRELYPASPVNKQHFSKMFVGKTNCVNKYTWIKHTLLLALPDKIIELLRSHKKHLVLEFLADS
jgi:hypothetical protein